MFWLYTSRSRPWIASLRYQKNDNKVCIYTFDCRHFLRKAVTLSVRLRLYLLHPVHRYEFDYSDDAEVYQAKAMRVLKGSDRHTIIPAVKKGNQTVGRALAYYNWANCDRCVGSA